MKSQSSSAGMPTIHCAAGGCGSVLAKRYSHRRNDSSICKMAVGERKYRSDTYWVRQVSPACNSGVVGSRGARWSDKEGRTTERLLRTFGCLAFASAMNRDFAFRTLQYWIQYYRRIRIGRTSVKCCNDACEWLYATQTHLVVLAKL